MSVVQWLKSVTVQKICYHELQADTQITLLRCSKCQQEYWYEKNVDLFPCGERKQLLDFCWVKPERHL